MTDKNKEQLALPGEMASLAAKFERTRKRNNDEFIEYSDRTVNSLKDPGMIDYSANAVRAERAARRAKNAKVFPDIIADVKSEQAFQAITPEAHISDGEPLTMREIGNTASTNVIQVDFVAGTYDIAVRTEEAPQPQNTEAVS